MKRLNVIFFMFLFLAVNLYGLKESKVVDYPLDVVYSTMIRYIVINENARIIQKDIEGAYIKFKSEKENISGTIEIIKIDKKKSKLVVNFEGAHYKMILFMKNFSKKIKNEQNSLKE